MTRECLVQVFADQLDAWMEEFHGLLSFQTAAVPESDPEKETLPDAVRGQRWAARMHVYVLRAWVSDGASGRALRAAAMSCATRGSVASSLHVQLRWHVWQTELVAHVMGRACVSQSRRDIDGMSA